MGPLGALTQPVCRPKYMLEKQRRLPIARPATMARSVNSWASWRRRGGGLSASPFSTLQHAHVSWVLDAAPRLGSNGIRPKNKGPVHWRHVADAALLHAGVTIERCGSAAK